MQLGVRQLRWHKMVKECLKKIGENNILFLILKSPQKFSDRDFLLVGKGSRVMDYGKAEREPHIISYKPDCVWKKGQTYRAIFEVEHLKEEARATEKRKYSIGSYMLGYLAYIQKLAKYLVFITDHSGLYIEIVTFKKLLPFEHQKRIHELCIGALRGSLNRPNMMIALEQTIVKTWKI